MGHKSDIVAINARTIEVLIEENDLNRALDLLKVWVDASHTAYRKEVILFKSRYNEIRQAERLGILTFSKVSRVNNKLKSDILDLLDNMMIKE